MSRHPIPEHPDYFWSSSDGDTDPDRHQTVYKETSTGAKEVKGVCYDRTDNTFHKK